jgi:hypothetical protein
MTNWQHVKIRQQTCVAGWEKTKIGFCNAAETSGTFKDRGYRKSIRIKTIFVRYLEV